MNVLSQTAPQCRADCIHEKIFHPLFLLRAGFLFFLCAPTISHAQPGQLALSSQIQYSTVIQGAYDPVTAYIYNTAAPGSASVDYSAFATFPYGNSGTYLGSRVADGGAGYVSLPFSFNSGLASPGIHSISVTATDTGTGGMLTQSGNVTVLAHGVPAFVFGGSVVQLSSTPPAQEPPVDPLAFGATGGGETFAAHAPNVINDPIAPTAELDLDSITVTGSPQITITLHPFTDQLASDDPAQGVAFDIDVDGSVPGTYFTTFELNYSDEQDLPGALNPGSEHGFFSVFAEVTPSGVTGGIVVPEPGTGTIFALGLVALVLRKGTQRRGQESELV